MVDPEFREAERVRAKKKRHKKRLSELTLRDELKLCREKIARLQAENRKLRVVIENLQGIVNEADDSDDGESENDSDCATTTPFITTVPDTCDTFMSFALESNYLHDKLVGFSTDEFGEIYRKCRPNFCLVTQSGDLRQRGLGEEGSISDRVQLWHTMYWLRCYPLYTTLAVILKVHTKRVGEILKRCLNVLLFTYPELKNWPSEAIFDQKLEESRSRIVYEDFKDVVCVVDGTEPQVPRPASPIQSEYYSGKKKRHSVNFLVFVWILTGEIFHVSNHFNGAHDQRDWTAGKYAQRFEEKDYGILADGGFYFNRAEDQRSMKGYKPIKKPRGGNLTPDQQEYNRHLSQYRVIVENSIGRMKQWRVFKSIFRHFSASKPSLIDIDSVAAVVATFANFKIRKKPLRNKEWAPS